MGVTWGGGGPGRRRRSAFAASAAASALLSVLAVPSGATAAAKLPELTGLRVTPSTCPGRADTLAVVRRPTFTAAAPAGAPDGARMLFEVWPRIIVTFTIGDEEPEKPRPLASGFGTRNADGTFTWRPQRALPDDGDLYWDARLFAGGEPVSAKTGRTVMTDPGFPRIHECRFSAQELREARARAIKGGWSLRRQLRDELWNDAFYRLSGRISRAAPDAYVAAEVDDAHTRNAWIAFRDGVPAGARALLKDFRQARPAGRIDLLTGRHYTSPGIQRRADLLLDLAEDSALVGRRPQVAVDLRTGTIQLDVPHRAGSKLTDAQLRRRVRAELAEKVSGFTLVPAAGGVAAGPARQPLRIVVVERDRW